MTTSPTSTAPEHSAPSQHPAPSPPGPNTEDEAADALAALGTAIDAAMPEAFRRAQEEIRSGVLMPLQQVLQHAAETHRHLQDEANFEAAGEAADEVLWQRVVAYRRQVCAEILRSVQAELDRLRIADAIGAAYLAVLTALSRQGDEVPETQTYAEAADLYAARGQDPLLLGIRKSIVRGRRRLDSASLNLANAGRRLIRKPPQTPPLRSRAVPARQLFDYHLQIRLPRLIFPLHEVTQQRLARSVLRLERAFSVWFNGLMEAEQTFDRVAFHLPAVSLPHPAGTADEDVAPEDVSTEEAEQPQPKAQTLTEAADLFQQLAGTLQQALEEAASMERPLPDLSAEDLRAAAAALSEDLRVGGTFQLSLKTRALPPEPERPAAELGASQAQWARWYQETGNRLTSYLAVNALRDAMQEELGALLQRTTEVSLQPVLATFATMKANLQAALEQARGLFEGAEDPQGLIQALTDVKQRALANVAAALRDLPGTAAAAQVFDRPGETATQHMQEHTQQLPERLTLHARALAAQEDAVTPGQNTFDLKLREMVSGTLAWSLPERLKDHVQPLRAQVMNTWSQTEQVEHIVEYNLDVALETLAAPAPAVEEDADTKESPEKTAIQTAALTTREGLARAADTLDPLARALYTPWYAFCQATFEVFQKDCEGLLRALQREASLSGRMGGYRARFVLQQAQLRQQAHTQVEQLRARSRRLLRLGQRQAQALIKKSQTAVGIEADEAAHRQTLDTLASIGALHEQLPLIYRKLFSFEALVEPTLMEGRTRDLVRIREHVKRWAEGHPAGTLVLTVPVGSGRTSFLNMLRPTALTKMDVRVLTLTERPATEEAFAAQLIQTLGLTLEAPPTLEAIEHHLLTSKRPRRPLVCLIDNLEHLQLCAPGATAFFERILIFFSRTDTRVLWIAAIGSLAWHFIAKTASAAASMVTAYPLASLDRPVLESIIVNRHRRSGLPLRFAEPTDLLPLLRQRLRRAKTPEETQEILRADYFDRLSKLSGQSLMLAFLYWLRSADFTTDENVLTVQPIKPLSFQFIMRLDLPRSFTLKAFLSHNTLTLEEHSRIFRMTEAQGLFIFESLLNQHIIRPAPYGAAAHDLEIAQERIRPDVRYQANRLLIHPITESLHAKHLIY